MPLGVYALARTRFLDENILLEIPENTKFPFRIGILSRIQGLSRFVGFSSFFLISSFVSFSLRKINDSVSFVKIIVTSFNISEKDRGR